MTVSRGGPVRGGDRFPTTRGSAILGLRSAEPTERARSLESLVSGYWRPVYKYIRVKWGRSNEEAEDLTQGFFLRAMEKEFFESYDPARARFRTYVRTCLDAYLANQHRDHLRLKRGGGEIPLSLDFRGAEEELTGAALRSPDSPETYFEAEWVRGLFNLSLETLRSECEARGKTLHFRIFERYDLQDCGEGRLTYEALGAELGVRATDVTNHLAFARREFRRILLDKLREMTASDEEFRREARVLLGEGGEKP
jgi:RNA polymerase sigma factor (sigma-70 family)